MLRAFLSRFFVTSIIVAAACGPATTDVGGHTQPPPDSVPPVISAVVAAAHTCALSDAGAVYCWGYDAENNGADVTVVTPTLATPAGLTFRSLSVSKVDDVTCAITTTGAAYCWGENDHGQ